MYLYIRRFRYINGDSRSDVGYNRLLPVLTLYIIAVCYDACYGVFLFPIKSFNKRPLMQTHTYVHTLVIYAMSESWGMCIC